MGVERYEVCGWLKVEGLLLAEFGLWLVEDDRLVAGGKMWLQ